VVALLVAADLVHRHAVPGGQLLCGVAVGARLSGDRAEGDLRSGLLRAADVVLPWQSAQLGASGTPRRAPFRARSPVDREDAVVALPARGGEFFRLIEEEGPSGPSCRGRRGSRRTWRTCSAPSRRSRGCGCSCRTSGLRPECDVPLFYGRHVPVAALARRGEVAIVDRGGGEGAFRHRVGPVAIRARRPVDDGLAVHGDHVAALRVDGDFLGVAPGAVHPLQTGGCGRLWMSAWQSVQETSVWTDCLYAPGSTRSDMPGNFPRAFGPLRPPGVTWMPSPPETSGGSRIAVAVEALPLSSAMAAPARNGGPGRRGPPSIHSCAYYRAELASFPPLVRCRGSQSRGESPERCRLYT